MRKKRQSSQQCCLALLGPTGIKAVQRTLMKLTLGGNLVKKKFSLKQVKVSLENPIDCVLYFNLDQTIVLL